MESFGKRTIDEIGMSVKNRTQVAFKPISIPFFLIISISFILLLAVVNQQVCCGTYPVTAGVLLRILVWDYYLLLNIITHLQPFRVKQSWSWPLTVNLGNVYRKSVILKNARNVGQNTFSRACFLVVIPTG